MDVPSPVMRPPRPTVVTVAGYLHLAAVGILLAVVGARVAIAIQYDAAIDRVSRISGVHPDLVSIEREGNIVDTVIVVVPSLLVAVFLAACLVPMRRGSNAARICTFVTAGLMLLVGAGPIGCGLLFVPLLFMASTAAEGSATGWPDAPSPLPEDETDPLTGEAAFYDALGYGSSDLLFAIESSAGLLVFALVVAVVVLLSVPPANRFFVPRSTRPARPAWVQQMPGQPYGYVYLYPYPPPVVPGAHAVDPAASVDPPESVDSPESAGLPESVDPSGQPRSPDQPGSVEHPGVSGS